MKPDKPLLEKSGTQKDQTVTDGAGVSSHDWARKLFVMVSESIKPGIAHDTRQRQMRDHLFFVSCNVMGDWLGLSDSMVFALVESISGTLLSPLGYSTREQLAKALVPDQKLLQIKESAREFIFGLGQAWEDLQTQGDLNSESGKSPLDAAVKMQRKRSGAFFTPRKLAEYCIKESFDCYIKDSRSKETEAPAGLIDASLNIDAPLNILDPSMGCGVFLLLAMEELASHHRFRRENLSEAKTPRRLLTSCQSNCTSLRKRQETHDYFCSLQSLHGVDLSCDTTDIARLCLWLRMGLELFELKEVCSCGAASSIGLAVLEEIWTIITCRLKSGNALIGTWQEKLSQSKYTDRARTRYLKRCKLQRNSGGTEVSTPAGNPQGESCCRDLLDLHAAMWFWPVEATHCFPDENSFREPTFEQLQIARQLADKYKFFHWQIEFPHLFGTSAKQATSLPFNSGADEEVRILNSATTAASNSIPGGFQIIVGNPPWEIEKPNSREFFRQHYLEFFGLGKQQALAKQSEILDALPDERERWQDYCEQFELVNGFWSDSGKEGLDCSIETQKRAPKQAQKQTHKQAHKNDDSEDLPFRYQGKGDRNAYKLMLELGRFLLADNGVLSFYIPAGIYNDQGCRELRETFFRKSSWLKLVGFDNSKSLFPIHKSFKFCLAVLGKTPANSETRSIEVSFGNTSAPRPEGSNFIERDNVSIETIQLPIALIEQTSPIWHAIPEIRSAKHARTMEKLFFATDTISTNTSGWSLQYRRELDMTLDSDKFVERTILEHKGFKSDCFGHWLKGKWVERFSPDDAESGRVKGGHVIFSADGSACTAIEDIGEVFLPLYEGRMVGQFDPSEKFWVQGKGRSAQWIAANHSLTKQPFGSQYFVNYKDAKSAMADTILRTGFLGVGAATNIRTMIASCLPPFPSGNSVPVFFAPRNSHRDLANLPIMIQPVLISLCLSACFNSLVFDFALRTRLSGTNLNYFVIEECPLPILTEVIRKPELWTATACLNLQYAAFAPVWQLLIDSNVLPPYWQQWLQCATTSSGRRRLRILIDSMICSAFGLDVEDLSFILKDCDLSATEKSRYHASGTLDPKGFWRMDSTLDVQDRHTMRVLSNYRHLQENGLVSLLQALQLDLRSTEPELKSGIKRVQNHFVTSENISRFANEIETLQSFIARS